MREREDGKEKEKDRKGSGFGERLKQTYSFTTKSAFFCRQPYSNHKLAFSALLREQHVCLGEKNGIKCPVHVSTLALFVLTEGLVKRTVYFAESLSTANNNTTFSLQRGTRVNDVILPINVFDVFGLLA